MTTGELNEPNSKAALPLTARIALHWALRGAARRGIFTFLGPGLIIGASDDDPSGIATYSQVGAQFDSACPG